MEPTYGWREDDNDDDEEVEVEDEADAALEEGMQGGGDEENLGDYLLRCVMYILVQGSIEED